MGFNSGFKGLNFMKRHKQACCEHYTRSAWALFVTHATLK